MATLHRGDEEARVLPLPRRDLGELLAEELRRMDPDPVYAEALAATTGVSISDQTRPRLLVWRDPALKQPASRQVQPQENGQRSVDDDGGDEAAS